MALHLLFISYSHPSPQLREVIWQARHVRKLPIRWYNLLLKEHFKWPKIQQKTQYSLHTKCIIVQNACPELYSPSHLQSSRILRNSQNTIWIFKTDHSFKCIAELEELSLCSGICQENIKTRIQVALTTYRFQCNTLPEHQSFFCNFCSRRSQNTSFVGSYPD